MRTESDSRGEIDVPEDRYWGAQTQRSLMLVTALSPVIGYDKASHAAHHAFEHDLTLRQACLDLGYIDEAEFDRVVDPGKMLGPSL